MIELKELTKYFGKKCAVNNVNLRIERGDIFALLGPNGAGKSTMLNMITGLLVPSHGQIIINNKNLRVSKKEILHSFGVLFENPTFYEYLSGRDNMFQFARLKGIFDKSEIDSLLSLVSLLERANDLVKYYSLGMKQRLALACALIGDPEILILDEPTNGLDPEGINTTLCLLKKLSIDKKRTIVISSHQVYDVETLCNKIAIINEGIILCQGDLNSLIKKDIQSCLIATDKPDECKRFLINKPWVKNFKFVEHKKSLKEFYIEIMEKTRK